jgi:hypothetical protein
LRARCARFSHSSARAEGAAIAWATAACNYISREIELRAGLRLGFDKLKFVGRSVVSRLVWLRCALAADQDVRVPGKALRDAVSKAKHDGSAQQPEEHHDEKCSLGSA